MHSLADEVKPIVGQRKPAFSLLYKFNILLEGVVYMRGNCGRAESGSAAVE